MGPSGRRVPMIRSLRNSLKGHPLKAISKLLLENYTKRVGRTMPKWFVDILIHHHYW
jgi:hypothetical protein